MKSVYQQDKKEVEEWCQKHPKDGVNELVEGKKKGIIQIFLEQFKDVLVIILIVAATISGFLGELESAGVIFFVITMNAILGTVQHKKAEKSLDGLKQLSAPLAKVKRGEEIVIIPSREVQIGDLVLLEAGDYVPADGRIWENASLQINESALTGESTAVEKEDTTFDQELPLGDRVNMVYSGSFVTYGRGNFLVTSIGMDTEVGKIATLLKNTEERKTPLQTNLDQFGKKLSFVILIICGILFGVSILKGEEIVNAFMFAVALAVAAIPEALSAIVTIVLAFGTEKMAKEQAIIRKLQAVEGLGSVSVICSDKTGTLTQNKMKVIEVYTTDEKKLKEYSVLCSDASIKDGVEIGDPTEIALVAMIDYVDQLRNTHERISEVPFDSDRKLMSTLHEIDGRKIMITKGAPDVITKRVSSIESGEEVRDFTDKDFEDIKAKNYEFSSKGLRVLAFAYKYISDSEISVEDEKGLTFIGLISMMDPPREESKEAVARCVAAGIRPIMITGDHKITAAAIATQIGILKPGEKAVEGSELDKLTDDEMLEFVEDVSVYARVSPEHKIRIVSAWQRKGNIVSMTGDGVNDAPALKQADIGVAMGITGTEVSKDASSMVLADDNFATIVKAVENGRNVYANIKKSISFLLSGNTAGILAVLYASLAALPVPFAAVHLLFINLLTDSLPAIALGLDPHNGKVMQEKPRPKDESILTKNFMISIVTEGLVIGIATMAMFYVGMNHGGLLVAQTMAFSTLCLSRLAHGFNSKSECPILFSKQMYNNVYLWGAFFLGMFFLDLVLLLPQAHSIFKVATLSLPLLLLMHGVSIGTMFVIEGVKAITCRIKKNM